MHWEKSKERREEERLKILEKDDRIRKAAAKQKTAPWKTTTRNSYK